MSKLKVKIIGRNRPFWDGTLRVIGTTVDVDEAHLAKPSKWMGDPKSSKEKPYPPIAAKVEAPKVETSKPTLQNVNA